MKIEPASLDDGAFLNDGDRRGTLLHRVNIQKLFLTVGQKLQQFNVVALHFDISPVFLSRLWQHSISHLNRFLKSAKLGETENKHNSASLFECLDIKYACFCVAAEGQWLSGLTVDQKILDSSLSALFYVQMTG